MPEARFRDRLAPRYAAQPVKDGAAFDRKKAISWLGKAPRVSCYDRETIRGELAGAGFVDVMEHDVGAEPIVAFVIARKPETR
jgi:uncharacterized phage protein gp47/JayE